MKLSKTELSILLTSIGREIDFARKMESDGLSQNSAAIAKRHAEQAERLQSKIETELRKRIKAMPLEN